MTRRDVQTVRLTCPHNCYGTCGMIAITEDGVLRHVYGDPDHPYTRGRLCAKGYSYVDRVYATDRLRHPMIQSPRGSGRWKRLTWDQALGMIAQRIVAIYRRDGSLLPLGLYRVSGAMGALQAAPNALFRSIAPFTETVNVLCWATGLEAQRLDFGGHRTSDPLQMREARTLLIWGANPAWTAPQQMKLIVEAQERGARVVVIDPITTATATRADLHLAPRAGTDGALALGMARAILEAGLVDDAFLAEQVLGWPEFRTYLQQEVTVEWAARETGLTPEAIRQVARLYAGERPGMIWIGYGLQRHRNAGQTVRAIDALAAITGQIGRPGTGVQFAQLQTMGLDRFLRSFDRDPAAPNRRIPNGAIGRTLPALTDPPVEMLWVAAANPVCQEPDTHRVRAALAAVGFVVVVDQFLTRTAELADIVLPTTTFPEQWNLNAGYWHHLVSVSQPAIAPRFEARSDLQIAWDLARAIDQLAPGLCRFPTEGDEREWVERCWQAVAPDLSPGASFADLLRGPVRADLPDVAWDSLRFTTPSGRYELRSQQAVERGLPALPTYAPPPAPPEGYPYRLLTPHTAESLHSQFHGNWGLRVSPQPVVEMHPDLAAALSIGDGEMVRLYNHQGELHLPARLTVNVPVDALVAYETFYPGSGYNVNWLTPSIPGPPMGEGGFPGVPYHDCFVAVEPSLRRG